MLPVVMDSLVFNWKIIYFSPVLFFRKSCNQNFGQDEAGPEDSAIVVQGDIKHGKVTSPKYHTTL